MASIPPDSKRDPAHSPGQARRAIDGASTRERGRLLGLWPKWHATTADPALLALKAIGLQMLEMGFGIESRSTKRWRI